jgi:hypothetical protein
LNVDSVGNPNSQCDISETLGLGQLPSGSSQFPGSYSGKLVCYGTGAPVNEYLKGTISVRITGDSVLIVDDSMPTRYEGKVYQPNRAGQGSASYYVLVQGKVAEYTGTWVAEPPSPPPPCPPSCIDTVLLGHSL